MYSFTAEPITNHYQGEFQDKFGLAKKKKLELRIEVQEQEDGCLLYMKGETSQTEPKFEAQLTIDPQEGVCAKLPLPECQGILAVYQHKCWWTRPAFPKSFGDIPANSQMILLKYPDHYVCILAVCSEVYRGDLEGAEDGILIRLSSNKHGMTSVDALAAAIACGQNPYECIERAGKNAAAALGHPEMLRKNRRFPELFKKFGWCSWDAFYHEVNEEGLLDKVKELKEKQVPVGWVLIDDGWLDADLDSQLLRGVDTDKSRFPHGLGTVVRRLKEEQIPYVGVWHAVMGYWNGLEKDSAADQFFAGTTETLPDGRIVPSTEPGKAFSFYDRWHQYLKSQCGIDFIKVDGQSSISIFHAGRESYGEASGGLQKGLNASAALHFDNAIINCMGMGAEDVWHRPSSMITRTSDDFVPNVEHGFREHAIQNAYGSLWSGLFYTGDWDMFFSEHPENRQNGILRAISGGPVYTSDKVGRTNPEMIRPLILEDGTILRCEDVGLPTVDSLFEDPTENGTILKIFNRKDDAWYIAAFNIRKDGEAADGKISMEDIPALSGGEYVVYDTQTRSCGPLSEKSAYSIHLEADEAVMYQILPKRTIQVYGIAGKYISGATVEKLSESPEEVCVRVLEKGDLICSADRKILVIRQDGQKVSAEREDSVQRIPGCRRGEIFQITLE